MNFSPKAIRIILQSLTSYQLLLARAALQTDNEDLKSTLDNDAQFVKEITNSIHQQQQEGVIHNAR